MAQAPPGFDLRPFPDGVRGRSLAVSRPALLGSLLGGFRRPAQVALHQDIENYLSDNEQNVSYNFSESGVHPLTLGGLLDMAGLAQKGGAVVSHVRIAPRPEDLHSVRISAGRADLVLGCDLVVAGGFDAMSKITAARPSRPTTSSTR